MLSSRLTPWAARITALSGLAWLTISLLTLYHREPKDYLDVVMLAPLALSVGAISAVYLAQREQLGRLGRAAYPFALVTLAGLLAGQSLHLADLTTARDIVLIPSMAGWVVSYILFGIASVRARVLPAWVGITIALSEPLTVLAGIALSPIAPLSDFGGYSGAIAHALIWLAIANVLRERTATVVRRPATA
jgi:hypothetical protein